MRIFCLDTPGTATLEAIRDIGFDMTLQWKLLLYSLMLGAALAALFDIMRISRVFMTGGEAGDISKKPGLFEAIVIFFEDTAFFVIAALTVTVFVFHANHGDVRGFLLFGTLGGFFLYLNTLGRITVPIAGAVVRLITRLLLLILTPVFTAARTLYRATLGRLFAAAGHRYSEQKTARTERALIRRIRLLFDRKGSMDESGTTVNTCKARDLHGIHLHDHHAGQRADPLQQSAGGAGEARGAHRRRTGRHRRASE